MRVDHRRADVVVPEELLHRTDVVAVFQQVRRERMPERVLRDAGAPDSVFDGPLKPRLVQMMAPALSRRPRPSSEPRALEHAKSRAIHEERHQSWNAAQSLDDGADLVTRQDDRKPRRPLSPDEIVEPGKILVEDFAIKEEQCARPSPRDAVCRGIG